VALAAANTAAGPAADLRSGTFSLPDGSGFTTSGFGGFSGAAFGTATGVGEVTLNTGTAGTFTEIITFDPTGSNASGSSAPLASETLTITGIVAAAPVIAAPSTSTARQGQAVTVPGVSLSDVSGVGPNRDFTVTLSDTDGLLSANIAASGGGGTITSAGSNSLTISGSLGPLNADLSTLTDLDNQLLPTASRQRQ
jgi:hypothetical protein